MSMVLAAEPDCTGRQTGKRGEGERERRRNSLWNR